MVKSPLGHPNPYVRLWRNLPWAPPDSEREETRVIRDPVWGLKEIQSIADTQRSDGGNRIISISEKCTKDLQKLTLTSEGIAERLLELNDSHYCNSSWCQRSHLQGMTMRWEQTWFPCDAYAIRRHETVNAGWEGLVEYYFKFCLNPGKTRIFLLSVHL